MFGLLRQLHGARSRMFMKLEGDCVGAPGWQVDRNPQSTTDCNMYPMFGDPGSAMSIRQGGLTDEEFLNDAPAYSGLAPPSFS